MLLTVIHLLWVFKMINRFKTTLSYLSYYCFICKASLTTAKTLHLTNLCLQAARNSELDGTCLLPKVVKVYINKSICFVPLSHPGTPVSVLSYAAYMLIRLWRASSHTETSHLLYYERWQCRNITL